MSETASYITPAHYHGIGFVAVNWAAAETLVMFCLSSLLETDELEMMAVFWHMGFNDRRDRLVNLVVMKDLLPEAEMKEFDCLITRLNAAYLVRNVVVHSVWSKSDKPNSITPHTAVLRGGKKPKVSGVTMQDEHFTPERLVDEGSKTARLAVDLAIFAKRHFGYLPELELPEPLSTR